MPLPGNRSRWLGWTVNACAGIFVGLHIFNYMRIDSQGLKKGTSELVERAVAISNRAMPEYQDLVIATLPPNPNNGSFYRFDDNLSAAKSIEQASATQLDEDSEFEYRLEFEGGAESGLVANAGRTTVEQRDGLLIVTHRDGDYR